MKKTNTKTISFIGSGNVATHLALALQSAGHQIVQVLSREYDHAELLASRVGAEPVDRADGLRDGADFYIFAVGDDALYDLGLDLHFPDSVIIHTSGATPAEVLNRISRRFGVVWSPQTFVRDIAMDYSQLPLCIEGCNESVADQLDELFSSFSDSVYRLDFSQRRWAHLAAVMVSNFGNAIGALAQQTMLAHDLDFNMLRPLAEQTMRKWDYGDLRACQTGPAVRHDEKTLNVHRRLLRDQPRLLELYNLLTELIQQPPDFRKDDVR